MSDTRDDVDALPRYVFGHSDREIDRLKAQAHLIDPITQRFFREAGILPGMRVLDVGTGAGDVAFLAATMVGEHGEVVGIDRVPAALDVARARASARSLRNVRFLDGDPAVMTFDRPFDAVIGRYVLQFQSDPAAMLRSIAGHVRPEGVVAFHEIDWRGLGSFPPAPLYDQCCRWCVETLRLHGTETGMGSRLHATFVAAGLPPPSMRLEALIGGGANSFPLLQLVADLIATLLPEMERLGVATAAEVGLETLFERLCHEAVATSGVRFGHDQVGAWTRVLS